MNILKKFLAISLSLFAFVAASVATATPFNKAVFDKLLAEGKPVVVDFYADWCPTCKTQAPIIKELAASPAFKNVTILTADFDKEVELKKQLRVTKQSTLVVFKGGKEVTRSTGQTKKEAIAETLGKAL